MDGGQVGLGDTVDRDQVDEEIGVDHIMDGEGREGDREAREVDGVDQKMEGGARARVDKMGTKNKDTVAEADLGGGETMIMALKTESTDFEQGTGFLFGSRHTCYDDLGCFSTASPFDNALGYLPEDPEHVKTSLTLFSRAKPFNGSEVTYNDVSSFRAAGFDPKKPTKFIIHGYMSFGIAPWVLNMTTGFLRKEDSIVIVVDWRAGASKLYPQSVANTRLVAAIIASALETLKTAYSVDMSAVHLVGHSLGAQIAGYVGSAVDGIGRITGLDAAGPMFVSDNVALRLDPTDATFVDLIHTDASPLMDMGFGYKQPCGHIDFYPNGGEHQIGCPAPVRTSLEDLATFQFAQLYNSVACAHERSHAYFIESLFNDKCQFLSRPCESYNAFLLGNCSSCGSNGCPVMGYYADRTHNAGSFYLRTNSRAPFCQ
ncbi:hypothetical protein ScPMuIL_006664 [Solemya velum]